MSDDKEIRIDQVREFVDKNGEDVWPGGRDNTANVLGEHRELSESMSEAEAKRAMFARSRRGFLVGGVAALAGIFGWRWMSWRQSPHAPAWPVNLRPAYCMRSAWCPVPLIRD